jgi:hypothetical protein
MVGFSWATGQADICTAEACEFFLEGMFLHAWLRCPFLTFGAGHNCMQRRAQHMYYQMSYVNIEEVREKSMKLMDAIKGRG